MEASQRDELDLLKELREGAVFPCGLLADLFAAVAHGDEESARSTFMALRSNTSGYRTGPRSSA